METYKKYGFTLIELSLVLVIIGLIVGGILVGRDLIASAAIRSQITQLSSFTTAAHTFKSKYETWPGDLSTVQATKFGLTSYFGGGNNDGQILDPAGSSPAWNHCCEFAAFFFQLEDTKLIASHTDHSSHYYLANFPKLALNNAQSLFVQTYNGSIWFFLALTSDYPGGSFIGGLQSTPALTPLQANALDSKLDDGIPNGGNVFASGLIAGTSGAVITQTLDTAANQCVTTASASTYNISGAQKNTFWCRLYIRMQ